MSRSLLFILGTPRSGINTISHCLKVLDIKPLSQESTADADTINQLLIQDLGVSPYSPALPKGWMESDAAHKARGRIDKLLSSVDKLHLITAKPLVINLWQQAFNENKVNVKYILMLRHPWETAQSMAANHNLDLQSAHILWLAHTRAALSALEGQDYSLVTYDQLLADPISTLDSFLPSSPNNNSLLTNNRVLLDFLQPNLKNHQASDFPKTEAETYKPYAKLYDQIRTQHISTKGDKVGVPPAQQDASLFDPRSADQKKFACPVKQLDKSSRRGLTGVQIRLPRETGVPSGVFHWGADSPAQLNRLAESSPQGIQPG